MATRSHIAVQLEENLFLVSYVHFDGYKEVRLPLLHTNYNTKELALELVNLGDMSSIGESIEKCDTYKNRGEDWEEIKPRLMTLDEMLDHNGEYYTFKEDGGIYIFIEEENLWVNIQY